MIKFLLGMLAFASIEAFAYYEQAATIPQILSNPTAFYGRTATVKGIAGSVRTSVRTVDYKTREQAYYYSFSLYEPTPTAGSRHYVSVSVPASAFGTGVPVEGNEVTITGKFKEPLQVGSIGQ